MSVVHSFFFLLYLLVKILTAASFNRFVLNEQASRPAPSSPQGGSVAGGAGAGQGLPQLPPGMSLYAVKRVIGEAQWSPEQLEQVINYTEL